MIQALLSQCSMVILAALGVLTAFLWTEWREAVELIGQKDAQISSLSAANEELARASKINQAIADRRTRELRELKQHEAARQIEMREAMQHDTCAATPAPAGLFDRLRNGSR